MLVACRGSRRDSAWGGADARMLEAAEENWPVGADVQAWCLELSIKSAGCGLV